MKRRDFLLGSAAMAATMAIPGNAVLVGEEPLRMVVTGQGSFGCYAFLKDGLMYWSGNALDSWEPVSINHEPAECWQIPVRDGDLITIHGPAGGGGGPEPFDKSPDTGVATLPEVAS